MSTPPFDTAYLLNLFSSILGPSGELSIWNDVYANQIIANIQGTVYVSNIQIVLTLTAMESIPANTTLSMYAINNIPLNDITSIMDVLEGVYAGTITMIDTNYPANSYLVWYSYAMNQVGCSYPTSNCYMNTTNSYNLTNFLGYSNMSTSSVPSYSLINPSIAYNSIPVTPYVPYYYPNPSMATTTPSTTTSSSSYAKNGFIGFFNNIGRRRNRR
jgi:hypothetical protein